MLRMADGVCSIRAISNLRRCMVKHYMHCIGLGRVKLPEKNVT